MKTTNDLLDELKRKHELTSDYQLCQLLAWPTGRMSIYRAGRRVMDDATGLQFAELLELEPGEVLLWLHAERAEKLNQPDVVKALKSAARVLAKAAMLAGAAVTMSLMPPQAEARFDNNRISSAPSLERERAEIHIVPLFGLQRTAPLIEDFR